MSALSPSEASSSLEPLSLQDYLKSQQALVQELLGRFFPEGENSLSEAIRYSLLLPSKRLRPIFCLETCRAFGVSQERAYSPAVAIESIHTYSLVHDDLPCMDDDDLRRGQPTNHKKYGEARAVLAGDALLTKAFEILSQDLSASAETRCAWVADLAKAAGAGGMVWGQDIDMYEQPLRDKAALENLHRKKTGALLAASVTMGAVAGGASKEQVNSLREFASDMGLAFQIQDDVLDVEGGVDLGKPVKSDERNSKSTYVSVLGLEKAKEEAHLWYESALSKLKSCEFAEPNRLEELTRFVIERKV